MVWLKPINNQSLLYLQPNLAAAAARVKRQDQQGNCDPVGVRGGTGDTGIFFSTWKVIGREWILHLIDVGLKLINFELMTREKKRKTLVKTRSSLRHSCSPLRHTSHLRCGGHALHFGSLLRQFLRHPLSLLICLLWHLRPGG